MKKLFFAFFAIALLTSCGKDEKSCTQEEFLGSYVGTRNCDNVGDEEYTTTFSAGPENNQISWNYNGSTYDLKISGCKAKFSNKFLGQGFEVEFERMDDGSISGSYTNTALVSVKCDIDMTK